MPLLTVDEKTWHALAAHPKAAVRRALLALPVPAASDDLLLAARAATMAGSKATARRGVAFVQRVAALSRDDAQVRERAVATLLALLEGAVSSQGGDGDADVVSCLDGLRGVGLEDCSRSTLDGVVMRAFDMASSKQALSVDAEDEGWLLDFVNDGLDLGARAPTAADVEAAVRVTCVDARNAFVVDAFFRDPDALATAAERCADGRKRAAAALVYGPRSFDAFGDEDDNVRGLAGEVCHVGGAYVRERLYGIKQHLLARCLLLGRYFGGSRARVRARDAWKCLRRKDDRTKSAVLELVESDLPPSLKGDVLPILDPARAANLAAATTRRTHEVHSPLQASSIVDWLRAHCDALGDELADVLDLLLADDSSPNPPRPHPVLAAVALLDGFRPFEHALVSQHLAPLAVQCATRTVTDPRESLSRQGESYVVCAGRVEVEALKGGPRVLGRGEAFQDWHALGGVAGWDLPVLPAHLAPGCAEATLLVVDGAALRHCVGAVSPAGQEKGAKAPTSVAFHSFRLTFRRVIISRRANRPSGARARGTPTLKRR